MRFKLNIALLEETLDIIAKAHQKIVLVKHTVGNNDTSVAWVCFKPWKYNTIEWEEDFAIYASNTQIDNGATINKLSDKQASCDVCYPFEDGYFHSPLTIDTTSKNSYFIKNNDDEYSGITVGLAQDVVVNGEAYVRNPINAVYLPRGQFASMTPIESIDVYLKNDILDSTVITHINSKPLKVVFEEGEVSHTIGYNNRTGEFNLQV